jgi:hypothetical protein
MIDPSVTAPSMTDDRDRVMRIIVARCPEIGLDDLTQHAGAPAEPDLPAEIGRDIMAVLEAMEAKLDRLGEVIGVTTKDDDDADRRR